MKVVCQGNELSDALSKVVKALPSKRTNPILEGVRVTAEGETLTLFATDLELAIEKKINAKVLIDGEMIIPGKLFADYAKKIEEEEVELDGTASTKMVIKYLDSELQIKTLPVDEYPIFKEVSTENSFAILKKEFKNIINRVIFNVSVDEARPTLRGVCLNIMENELEAVASDGYRLALSRASIQNNGITEKIVVPAKTMNEIARLLDDGDEAITVYIEKNYIMVDLFHTKIVSRLISEEYINYEKIIPVTFTTAVTADKKLFENAIDRVSLVNRLDKRAYVKMEVREDTLLLSAHSEDSEINEKLSIGIRGKDLTIGFNSKYIIDCMHVIDEPLIMLNFTSSTAPCIINGNGDRWLYLILPLRVIG